MPVRYLFAVSDSRPWAILPVFGQEVPWGAPVPTGEDLDRLAKEIERETGFDPIQKLFLKLTERLAALNLPKTIIVESLLGEGGTPTLPDPFLRDEAKRREAEAVSRFVLGIARGRALSLLQFARDVVLLPVATRDP